MTDHGWPDPSRPGVPLNPERDGWHWLHSNPKLIPAQPSCFRWVATWGAWNVGNGVIQPSHLAGNGWVYLEPCLTPAEVAAQIAAAEARGRDMGLREAAGIAVSTAANEAAGGPKTDMRTSIYAAILAHIGAKP